MEKLPLLFVTALLLSGCVGPSDRQIKQEFQSRHPGCDLLSAETGEGDSDNVYVTFKMRCPDDDETSTQALFQKIDGKWKIKWQMPVMTQPI